MWMYYKWLSLELQWIFLHWCVIHTLLKIKLLLGILCPTIDIDECSDGSDSCSQNCINTAGSYRCNCNSGYTLAADGSSCTGMLL